MIYSASQYRTPQILFDTQSFLTLLARLCEGFPQPGHYIFQTLGRFLWRLLVRLPFTHPSMDEFVQNIIRRRCWSRFRARHCCCTVYCKPTTL